MWQFLNRLFRRKPEAGQSYQAKLPGTNPLAEGYLEATSPTWVFISEWAESELAECRQKNDSAFLDTQQTAVLRGKISILKQILELPDDIGQRSGLLQVKIG